MKPDQSHGRDRLADHLDVTRVQGRRDLNRFIRVPWRLYGANSLWIPPLLLERRQHLSPHNPYFQHAEWCAWLACRGDRVAGRITAQLDQLHLERHTDATGFFGMLEAEDDPDVFRQLFAAAENWLRERGMRRVRGPFNLSINHECGLLVDGFDTPPSLLMGHALPHYQTRVEELGYTAARDLLAYRMDTAFPIPAGMARLTEKMQDRIHMRCLRRSRLDEDIAILRDIFNDAWSDNWSFVPFAEKEFQTMARDLVRLVDDEFIQIAEVDGEPAAMIVILPNVNEAIRDLNGHLLPFGWLKLLWRLKVTYPQTARVPLMGVRKRHQSSLLGSALTYLLIDALREPVARRGVREVEMSWILEDNGPMRRVIESLGGEAYKRYRIYEKALGE